VTGIIFTLTWNWITGRRKKITEKEDKVCKKEMWVLLRERMEV
jgi:hypothetical protein